VTVTAEPTTVTPPAVTEPGATVTETAPAVTVTETAPAVTVTAEAAPAVTVTETAPAVTVTAEAAADRGGAPSAGDGVAVEVLGSLPVKGRAPKTGFERDLFGSSWTDAVDVQGGRNGCDTRIICTPGC
jgi:hypothetical protein